LKALEEMVVKTTGSPELVVPLLARLLSMPIADRYKPLALSPQRQKDETAAALVNHVVGLARDKPVLMVLEDAHWIDPTSREVLDLLVDRAQDISVLIVITCRPEFQPSWSTQSHITTLTLNRLSRQLRAALVESVAGSNVLPHEVVEQIILKTDGVPLFLEELTKAVLELHLLSEKDGQYPFSGPLVHIEIPATLTDLLMARLDRMGSFKEVAQIGATLGREFSYKLLRAVVDIPMPELDEALSRLEDSGLIVRRGRPPEAIYLFKHALVQDAAHSSLLHSDRKRLHARIAAVLAEMYPESIEREPELLAHHFTEAGQTEPAVGLWLKAGKHAAKTRANLEAIGHLERGLEVLNSGPATADRNDMELLLRIELGISLIAAKGYAVEEVERNYLRALELGQQLGNKQNIFTATRGLWVCYFIRADLIKAHDLGLKLLKLAEGTNASEAAEQSGQRTGHLIEAHRALGMTFLYGGHFIDSREHLERAMTLYKPHLHGSLVELTGIEPGIVCLSYLGFLLWFLGCPDEARQFSNEALSRAEKLRHPFTLAFALAFRAYLSQHLHDVEGTRDYAKRALAISSDHGFRHWKHQATILGGWALAELGQIDDGLYEIRAGLTGYELMGSWLDRPWFYSLLAKAYLKAGRRDAALRALDDAIVISRKTGERFVLAEIYRLQGEISLQRRDPETIAQAEACYRHSFEICREQKALSWELRTALSLARLWQVDGKRQEAANLLDAICSRFKEGFDTWDLKNAVRLLDELKAIGPDIS
jgi:predicted ATPase